MPVSVICGYGPDELTRLGHTKPIGLVIVGVGVVLLLIVEVEKRLVVR